MGLIDRLPFSETFSEVLFQHFPRGMDRLLLISVSRTAFAIDWRVKIVRQMASILT